VATFAVGVPMFDFFGDFFGGGFADVANSDVKI
jgi:hypothetical protein